MPAISADTLQLAMVKEVSAGVTPATPSFLLWRTTGESLIFAPNTTENDELGSSGRSVGPASVTGMTVSGDINFNLAKFDALEEAISGVLGNPWGECPLTGAPGGMIDDDQRNTIGDTMQTYTIEKRFPDPATPGSFLYQRYVGCSISAITLTTAPNANVTGSISIVGGTPVLASAAIAGATYAAAATGAVFVAPQVLELDIGAGMSIGTHCWQSLTLTIDSQNRGIACIGTQGEKEVVLGTATVNLSGDVLFYDQTILEALLNDTTFGDGKVVFSNADSDIYRFDLYGLKPVGGELSAGGAGEDLAIPAEFQPTPTTVCDDAGTLWKSGVVVSMVDTLPVLAP